MCYKYLLSILLFLYSLCCCSVNKSWLTLCDLMNGSKPGFPVLCYFPRVCSNSCPLSPWCHPTISSSVVPFSSCLQSFPALGSFPRSQFFASGGQSIGLCFSISPSNEYSGLIFFRIDWLDLLAVWGTLKSLLQHHSSKTSILRHSAFFMVQFSYQYMTPGRTTALTRWTSVNKVMSLLFNMLSRLVVAFLPRASAFSFHGFHYLWIVATSENMWLFFKSE